MSTVRTETMLSPWALTEPAGKAKSPVPVVELPRNVPFSQTENAWALPPEIEDRWMPVSDPVAWKRPRYHVLPVWKPEASGHRTGSEPGVVVEFDDILSATTQLESSKPGCASGDSSWCFQP